MSINRNNYEVYLIDYLDGKLDATGVSEVLLFLEQHPDIKAEFDGIAGISVEAGEITSPGSFAQLKRKEFEDIKSEYEHLLIADLEGELNAKERVLLQNAMQLYPQLKTERALFAQTVLTPDTGITYGNKQALKRGSVWVLHRNIIMRAAAVLLVAVSAGWFLIRDTQPTRNPAELAAHASTGIHPNHPVPNRMIEPQPSGNPVVAAPGKTVAPHQQLTSGRNAGEPQLVITHTASIAVLPQVEMVSIAAVNPSVKTGFTRVGGWLVYTPPTSAPTKNDNQYTDLRTLAGVGLNRGAQQLESKTLSVVEAVNKAAGVSMEKDEVTGRIKRFEIAGLGFEWSQSK